MLILRTRLREGPAIVLAEIPLSSLGFAVRIQQHPMFPADLAIEILHSQLLPSFRVCGKLRPRLKEVPVHPYFQRKAGQTRCAGHGFLDAPFARLGHHDPLRFQCRHRPQKFTGERLRIPGLIELHVVDSAPQLPL